MSTPLPLPPSNPPLTVEGLLLEDVLDVALLFPDLALAGSGREKLFLQALALQLLGVGRAGQGGLEAAVEAAPRRAPCGQN